MDDYATIGRALDHYMSSGDRELGVCLPVSDFLPELTTIVEGIMGHDTTNRWWAYDEKAFQDVASHPQFREAMNQRGLILSIGEAKGQPHITISRVTEQPSAR